MPPYDLHAFDFKGHRVAYIDEGAGDPIVFIHNGGQSHRIFDRQLEHFAKTHRVIAMDWLGLGASDKPRDIRYDAFLYTDQIDALTAHLQIDRFDLVGCCVGGGVAIMYAQRNPERVRTLTTVTIDSPITTAKGKLGVFLARPGTAKYSVLKWMAQTPMARLIIWPQVLKAQLGAAGFADKSFTQSAKAGYANPDVAHTFTAFDYFSMGEVDTGTPVKGFPRHLAIWGEDNPVLLATHGRKLAEKWNAEDALFLNGCGYGILREAPDAVNESITRHLALSSASVNEHAA